MIEPADEQRHSGGCGAARAAAEPGGGPRHPDRDRGTAGRTGTGRDVDRGGGRPGRGRQDDDLPALAVQGPARAGRLRRLVPRGAAAARYRHAARGPALGAARVGAGGHPDADGADADRADRRGAARPGAAPGLAGPGARAAARTAPDHAGPGHRPRRDRGLGGPGRGARPVLRRGRAPAAARPPPDDRRVHRRGGGCDPGRAGPPKGVEGFRALGSLRVARLRHPVPRTQARNHGSTASASISTSQAGSSRPATITAVAAGRAAAKTWPCARATSSQCSAAVRYMRVRTTCSRLVPAWTRAAPIRSRQSRAWAYGPAGGGPPPAGTGAVPATRTRSPATTARENPNTGSYGEWPLMRRTPGIVSSGPPAPGTGR